MQPSRHTPPSGYRHGPQGYGMYVGDQRVSGGMTASGSGHPGSAPHRSFGTAGIVAVCLAVATVMVGLIAVGGFLTLRALSDDAPGVSRDRGTGPGDTGPQAASSRPAPVPMRPTVELDPVRGLRSQPIRVTGRDYQPGEPVEVRVGSTVLATVPADGQGGFVTTVRLRSDSFCPSDQCTVLAAGKQSIRWNTTVYDISG